MHYVDSPRVDSSAHWEVVANQVPVALLGVKLDGKSTWVSQPLWGAGGPSHD